MSHKNLLTKMFLLALTLILTGCVPATATPGLLITQTSSPTISVPVVSISTATPTFDFLATGEGNWEGYRNHTPEPTCPPPPTPISLTDMPPEWLFTPTPDPNEGTISVQIEGDHSQVEITRILLAKWLDHFLGENISPEWRLTAYTIDQVTAPAYSNYCASAWGGLFIAKAQVTAKTFLPSINKCGSTSQWYIVASPVSESETHRTIVFYAVIKKLEDVYTLQILANPMCN